MGAISYAITHAPAFVGVEKGIFLKHGLDVKPKVLNSGTEMAQSLQAGEAHFMTAAVSNMPVAREAGMPVVGVAGFMQDATKARFDEPMVIVGRTDRGLQPVQPGSLVGKKIGLAVGSTGDQYLTSVLQQIGVARNKVEVLHVTVGNAQSVLRSGSVDAVVVPEPFGTQILEKVPGTITVKRGGGLIGFAVMLSVSEKLVKERPDVVRRLVLAVAEATQYTRQHPDEAAEISTRWVPGLDLEVARKAIRFMQYDPRLSKFSLQNYQDASQDLVHQKKLKAPIPAAQAFNTTFIEQVLKERADLASDLRPIP
ncbi:MAG TPA: ABC transporter substrate-binding protein [Ramlibacter sp.]|nr:ABC transporter substrate-binding protein [Ramlibacter sp.]